MRKAVLRLKNGLSSVIPKPTPIRSSKSKSWSVNSKLNSGSRTEIPSFSRNKRKNHARRNK